MERRKHTEAIDVVQGLRGRLSQGKPLLEIRLE
jgi:hypothetical protein